MGGHKQLSFKHMTRTRVRTHPVMWRKCRRPPLAVLGEFLARRLKKGPRSRAMSLKMNMVSVSRGTQCWPSCCFSFRTKHWGVHLDGHRRPLEKTDVAGKWGIDTSLNPNQQNSSILPVAKATEKKNIFPVVMDFLYNQEGHIFLSK